MGAGRFLEHGTGKLRNMDFESLEREALRLPPEERARLAQELLESLESLSEPELERLWLDEAERRAAQIDRGEVDVIPGEQVMREARALLK